MAYINGGKRYFSLSMQYHKLISLILESHVIFLPYCFPIVLAEITARKLDFGQPGSPDGSSQRMFASHAALNEAKHQSGYRLLISCGASSVGKFAVPRSQGPSRKKQMVLNTNFISLISSQSNSFAAADQARRRRSPSG